MPVVRNNGQRTPLGLPGGAAVVPPRGGTATVPEAEWLAMQSNRIVQAWRKAGLLTVEGEIPAPIDPMQPAVNSGTTNDSVSPPPVGHAGMAGETPDETDAEKDEVIAALAEFGIVKDRRSSLPTLWGLLSEAKREHANA